MQELPPPEPSGTPTLESPPLDPEQPDAGTVTLAPGPTASSGRPSPIDPSPSRPGDMQRSPSPTDEAGAVKYTRTGRVSKATKGRRIHSCDECGKTYTRAEHLRRHQQNHKPGAYPCDVPGCGRSFFREDLLERHKARHNDVQETSRRASIGSDRSMAGIENSFAPNTQQEPAVPPAVAGADHDTEAVLHDVPRDISITTTQQSAVPRASSRKQGYIPLTELPLQAPIALDTSHAHSGYQFGGPTAPYSPSGYESPDEDNPLIAGPYYDQPHLARPCKHFPAEYLSNHVHPSSSRSPVSVGSSSRYVQPQSLNGQEPGIPYYAHSSSSEDLHGDDSCVTTSNNGHVLTMCQNGAFRVMSAEERDANELNELSAPLLSPSNAVDDFPFTTEQRYLCAYWHWIHPEFPILHKPTFDLGTASPLLRSAMLALGAHMSQTATGIENARLIHGRCVKVLKKRTVASLHTQRICDMQAIFLMEVYSQFKSRRPPLQLSQTFQDIFRSLAADNENFCYGDSLPPHDSQVSILFDDVAFSDLRDVHRHCKQRLLLSFYVLDQQQAQLFGRQRTGCLDAMVGPDLPWPRAQASWDAVWHEQAELDRRDSGIRESRFSRVSEALDALTSTPYHRLDAFQSRIALAGLCDPLNTPQTYQFGFDCATGLPNLPEAMEQTPQTTMAYHTTMLCRHTPIRDLLAVAGESWVLGQKLGSQDEYTRSQIVARDWATGASCAVLSADQLSVLQAVYHALYVLDIQSKHLKTGLIYQEWAVYLAAVVIWARAYVLDVAVECKPHLTVPSPAEPETSAKELDQAVRYLINTNASILGSAEAKSVLLWTKAKIEEVDAPHNCGLTNSLLDVLGKLCTRGNEEGWFG